MFEKATRLKLRYGTDAGLITTEDLWDLPLISRSKINLDGIAKDLNRKIKESGEESFVVEKSEGDSILDLKFEIVKYVIKIRMEENKLKEQKAIANEKKKRILDIIATKEDEQLMNQDLDSLKQMVAEL